MFSSLFSMAEFGSGLSFCPRLCLFVAAFLFAVSLCRYLLFMAVFICGRVPFAVSLRCLCSFLLFMAVLVYAGVPFVSSFCSWLCWRRFFAVAVCLVFPFCFFCSLLSFVLSVSLCSCALATVDILQFTVSHR